jgi:uncharacterized membrane protein YdfJ with MMPL/SSD domain
MRPPGHRAWARRRPNADASAVGATPSSGRDDPGLVGEDDQLDAIARAELGENALITCAALILAISFASLSTTNDIAVQVPATGLAVGVILDAVIVRTLLVPALAAMLGKWNWWMPEALARLLRAPVTTATSAAN